MKTMFLVIHNITKKNCQKIFTLNLIIAIVLCSLLVMNISSKTTASAQIADEEQTAESVSQPLNIEDNSMGTSSEKSEEVNASTSANEAKADGVDYHILSTANADPTTKDINIEIMSSDNYKNTTQALHKYGEVICYVNGQAYVESWYSQKVLPGYKLNIPGRHVNDYGLICDKDGYIVIASSTIKYGTVIKISLGWAKVYDTGCSPRVIDVYTDWSLWRDEKVYK